MTENELRAKVISIAKSYLGCKESDGSHKKIIDGYNAVKPLPRGYAVKYTDEWCATFVSFVSIKAGLTDIMPRECGCGKMIELYQGLGRWVENDAYIPKVADIIMYDWNDNGVGDCTGYPRHVGIVASISGNTMRIIEGNINESVGYRDLNVNSRYIRGYCIPNYASKATIPVTAPTNEVKFVIGDVVEFTGTTHYSSATATSGKVCKSGKAKITAIYAKGTHPYHLVSVDGGNSTVYGWVNESDIKGKIVVSTPNNNSTSTSTSTSTVGVEHAKSYDKAISGKYKTTTGLNMRAGAGKDKAKLCVIEKNELVNCYGYYTSVDGTKWYYVTYKSYKGFVSSKYLIKQ